MFGPLIGRFLKNPCQVAWHDQTGSEAEMGSLREDSTLGGVGEQHIF